MDTAWIPVFVLTFAECVAPSGKTVCQESEFELEFLSKASCEAALVQLVAAKDTLDTVIVDKEKTRCVASARRQAVFASLSDVTRTLDESETWVEPEAEAPLADVRQDSHKARLESMPTCEASKGVAPCKIGEIIIEEAESTSSKTEIWRRER